MKTQQGSRRKASKSPRTMLRMGKSACMLKGGESLFRVGTTPTYKLQHLKIKHAKLETQMDLLSKAIGTMGTDMSTSLQYLLNAI
eukprot:6201879-Amphidinium_carterae.1